MLLKFFSRIGERQISEKSKFEFYRLICSFDWCFTPCSEIFDLHDGIKHFDRRKPGSSTGKPTTVHGLLTDLPTYTRSGFEKPFQRLALYCAIIIIHKC